MIVDRFERKKEVAVGLLGAACACAELDVICPPPTWLRTTMACCDCVLVVVTSVGAIGEEC